MWQDLLEYLSVFVASALNLNYAIGLSLTYQLDAVEQFVLMSTGSVAGVATCLMLGSRLIQFWEQRLAKTKSVANAPARENLLFKIWRKYGLWGLAVCTVVVGPIPMVVITLLSGMNKQRIFYYLGGGKVFWSVVLTFVGHRFIRQLWETVFN